MTTYVKPYKFNIVLNSHQSSPASLGTNNEVYEFNWTNIPQGKYLMNFSFLAKNNETYSADDCPQLFLTLNTVPSVYQATGNAGSQVSQFIGNLRSQTHAPGQVNFYANEQDNPEVYYNNLPTSGPIRVQVFNDDFITPFTVGGAQLADYVMVLTFRKVGNN